MAKKNRQVENIELSAEEVEAVVEEDTAADAAPVEEPKAEEVKVRFDGWYAMRSGVIPAIHKKEILRADFKGQKVPMIATIAEFDNALKKYGVKLG